MKNTGKCKKSRYKVKKILNYNYLPYEVKYSELTEELSKKIWRELNEQRNNK